MYVLLLAFASVLSSQHFSFSWELVMWVLRFYWCNRHCRSMMWWFGRYLFLLLHGVDWLWWWWWWSCAMWCFMLLLLLSFRSRRSFVCMFLSFVLSYFQTKPIQVWNRCESETKVSEREAILLCSRLFRLIFSETVAPPNSFRIPFTNPTQKPSHLPCSDPQEPGGTGYDSTNIYPGHWGSIPEGNRMESWFQKGEPSIPRSLPCPRPMIPTTDHISYEWASLSTVPLVLCIGVMNTHATSWIFNRRCPW